MFIVSKNWISKPWQEWFAWRPVKLVCGSWAWLRYVERRFEWLGAEGCEDLSSWLITYRECKY